MPANNNQSVRVYSKEFKEMLQAVFESKAVFRDFFAGEIEAIDGVKENETAFYVKTSNIPVAVTDLTFSSEEKTSKKNVAFGTGTGNSSRFGQRTEIIYTDTPVPYTWGFLMHEGIDRYTVNNDLDNAVADRLEAQSVAKIEKFNQKHGAFISAAATINVNTYKAVTEANVGEIFNELRKAFVNNKTTGTRVAKVTPDVYSCILDCSLATTAKNSKTNIDEAEVLKFKGFVIEEVAEDYFKTNEVVYAYVQSVAKAFTGIVTTRTIESEDFDGVALQGAAKCGEYIPDDNKKAVAKVTLNPSGK